jgi:PAS domain S-box-containing protein
VTHWGEIGGEHRDRLRVLMEHDGDAVAELAADRQILFLSSSFKGLLGYAEAELLGTDFFALVHPDERSEMCELYEQSLADARLLELHSRFLHDDGSWRWPELRALGFTSDHG